MKRISSAMVLGLTGAISMLASADMASRVDFGYAFSTPHRMTVCRPESSDKTLLDVEPGGLRMSWSYDSLMTLPPGAFVTPPASWGLRINPQVNGHGFAKSAWSRTAQILPGLVNTYEDPAGTMTLLIAGGETAAMIQVVMRNTGAEPVEFALPCESTRGFFGYNPGHVDPGRPHHCLLAGWGDRADRVIAVSTGADDFRIDRPTVLCPVWRLEPGAQRVAWVVRPYRGYAGDLANLRARDWDREYTQALEEWARLLDCPMRITIPDPGVRNAFYACLGDLYVMREPIQGGRIAGEPGTDGYRAANTCEAAIVAIVLDQIGYHDDAADGYQVCFEWQGEDGDWADPQGWGHLMWIVPGFKSWFAREHYRLTRDKGYLEPLFPRMLANSRFQEKQRARTRIMEGADRPVTYGLMPRGMGDCGLKDGDSLYGVFFPHNMWAVYADKVALETAELLGKTEEAQELRGIYETALNDLLQALDKGAIAADGYRWIPGVPGKTSGSRWGVLNALTPCGILAPDHPLVEGTLRYIESQMSPGGLPLNTGWMPAGLWVAIALDNLAEVHLTRNEGDIAAKLLYATLNHGTPLYTWCEERGPQPGAAETTGDRQHLWTPVAVVRAIRDMLIMEQDGVLHLARGVDRGWTSSGQLVGVSGAETYFGTVSYSMRFNAGEKKLTGKASFGEPAPNKAVLHIRLPEGLKAVAVDADSGAVLAPDAQSIEWAQPTGEHAFSITVE